MGGRECEGSGGGSGGFNGLGRKREREKCIRLYNNEAKKRYRYDTYQQRFEEEVEV